jgi:hypothetical protein
MTREEFCRRVQSVSDSLERCPLEVIAGECSRTHYSAEVREAYSPSNVWCFVTGTDEGTVYDSAWSILVVRLCDNRARARKALDVARRFSDV